MIQQSSGPPVVFGSHLGEDVASAGGDLTTALSGVKWLALAVGVWFLWNAFKRGR